MFWGNIAASSADGGHNWHLQTLPGNAASGLPGNGFDYTRQAGSRTEPAGPGFNLMTVHSAGSDASGLWEHDEAAEAERAERQEEEERESDADDAREATASNSNI